MKRKFLYIIVIGLVVSQSSCKKEKSNDYEIPATYNFSNVEYNDQKHLIDMLTRLTDEMKKANTAGVSLDAQLLKNMYANTGNPFSDPSLDQSGISLKSVTYPEIQALTDSYLEAHAASSLSTIPGEKGMAGVIRSGIITYLSSAEGIEHTQLVGIGLQGAALYYQLTTFALSEDKIGSQVPLAERQHNWDQAFGFFGVPVDFPANPAAGKWLGKYSNLRNPLIGTNSVLMAAFIKGRAAIDHGDNETVAEQVVILRENFEKVMAAGVVHYCNEALSWATDDAMRNHCLSECISWTRALRYNPARKISEAQIQQAVGYLGTNFYTVSTSNILEVKELISSVYGLSQIQKDQL